LASRHRKGVLEASREWTKSQRNSEAENLLKIKGQKRKLLLNEAENILKNKAVNK
jgi:hypothetical protein